MINKVKKIFIKIVKRTDCLLVELLYCLNKVFNKNIKMNEKNIMILVSRLNNGGAEKVAATISDEISRKYNLVLVTCSGITDEDYKCDANRIILNDEKAKFLKQFSLVRQLKKIKKKNNITHTISFCSRMNYINTMSKTYDTTIISIRNYLSESEKEKKYKHINQMSGKYSDKIVVVSKLLIDDQIKNFNAEKRKISVIYNYCDEEKIKFELEEKNSLTKEKNTVINIGRLTEQKGQINLIRAFKKVVEEIPDVKLIILGQGELKEKLEKEIKELKLENNISLMGFKKNPYIYMKKAELFVLSSFYEGMSNVILEAMCCGLPIISTDCKTGTREIIAPNSNLYIENTEITKEEYGILVPVMKNELYENYLAEAIIEILKNKELREYYANKSKDRIKDFSKEKLIKKWFDIL